jgi:pilus assembly protein FimV
VAFNKEKVMDAARKYVDKGQIDKAVKEYLRIVREDPKDVRVWLKIGDLYAKKGSKQEATETYLKVARFYQEQGFYLKAVAVYKQILKLDPRLVEVNLKLAELYRQLGLMSDAMQHFESVAAHFHREGKTKEALATVRQLVDLDPENVATRIKLAELYSKEGLVEEAGVEFGQACEHLRKQGRQDDFIKVAERLLWHKPERNDLARELAGLYLRRNDPRRALQKLQTCFKADPRDVETLALLAQAFQALDQKAKTVSVLKELARVFDENKQRDKAEDVHRKILQFVPADPDALAYLGERAKRSQAAQSPPPALGPAARASRLNLTSDVQALGGPIDMRKTGSMPLVDDKGLTGDFQLPEYGEDQPRNGTPARRTGSYADDFAADLSLDDGGFARSGSHAGEVHAEEINKILTETDVYVKYGLYQKAVDHLRRVFALDPDNIEAHERLKDVYLAQGREGEALTELMKLAEKAAPSDPDRAEAYLREILSIDGGHRPAHDLARRHRLDLSSIPSVEVIDGGDELELDADELSSGAVAAVEDDIEFDDIDFGQSDPARSGNDVLDALDAAGLRSPRAASSPGRARSEPGARAVGSGLGPGPDATRELVPEHVRALSEVDEVAEELEFEDGVVDVAGEPWADSGALSLDDALDAQLDDSVGDEIDDEIAAELSQNAAAIGETTAGGGFDLSGDDLPFDPEAARAFDAAVPRGRPASGFGSVPTFDPVAAAAFDAEHPNRGQVPAARSLGAESLGAESLGDYKYREPSARRAPARNDFVDPGATEMAPPGLILSAAAASRHDFELEVPGALDADLEDANAVQGLAEAYAGAEHASQPDPSFDPAATQGGSPLDGTDQDDYVQVGDSAVVAAEDVELPSAGTLEDELDEADFYVSQGMLREAAELLRQLLARTPGHPLITAKLRDVEAAAAGFPPRAASLTEADQLAVPPADGELTATTGSLDLDEVEELDADMLNEGSDLHSLEEVGGAAPRRASKRPQVMLQKPIEDTDADTHYDLGLAYKEMGLHEEAIKAFEKVVQTRGREVQCRLMIGLCHREQGNPSEAVHQFKLGLHEGAVTDREKQSLLYEIGVTYEALGDPREALYYLEMVLKRDPTFLDARERVSTLRAQGSAARRPRPASDDPDGALDSLLAEDNT